jgi:hypothetical protein
MSTDICIDLSAIYKKEVCYTKKGLCSREFIVYYIQYAAHFVPKEDC